jgi:hypothetical protein
MLTYADCCFTAALLQDLEDCGPDHNNCDGGAYTDPDYNKAGFY